MLQDDMERSSPTSSFVLDEFQPGLHLGYRKVSVDESFPDLKTREIYHKIDPIHQADAGWRNRDYGLYDY